MLVQEHPAGGSNGVRGFSVEHLGGGDANTLGVAEEVQHVLQAAVAERGDDTAREETDVYARREAGVVPGGRAEAFGGEKEVAEAAGTREVGGDAGVVLDCSGVASDADLGEEREGLGPGLGFGVRGRGCGVRATTPAVRMGRWLRRGGGHGQRHGCGGGEWDWRTGVATEPPEGGGDRSVDCGAPRKLSGADFFFARIGS
jgi:hypothetical protein